MAPSFLRVGVWGALAGALSGCGSPPRAVPLSSSALPAAQAAARPDGGAAKTTGESLGPVRRVVVVSIDGLMPATYMQSDASGPRVPTLKRLAREGAFSDGVRSVYPTVTYPAHTTMVTGVVPGKHGIVGNRTFDPTETDMDGWRWYAEDIRRPTVWELAERAGHRVGLVHWPVSVGARVTWRVPEFWRAQNAQDPKLLRAVSTPGLLEATAERHGDFWQRYTPAQVRDSSLMDIALHILEHGRPRLLMVHLIEVDSAQHRHGLGSPEAKAAVEEDDRQLARLVEALSRLGLEAETALLVLSDHGFMNVSRTVRPCVVLREAGLVDVDAAGKVKGYRAAVHVNSAHAYVYLADGADDAVAHRARSSFESNARSARSGIGRIYGSDEIRAAGGDPQAVLALEATPGVQFAQGCAGAYEAPGGYKGTHGYDPQRPEMAASLLVRAPGFPPGRLVDVRLVDIAPTIADWLGLALADVDGVSLRTCVADSRTSARDAVERDASESGARPTLRCRR